MKANTSSKIITVCNQDDGQRLDNYLFRNLSNAPKSYIYRIIRKGEVRVNSGRKHASYKLGAGDKIRIPPMYLVNDTEKLVLPQVNLDKWVIFEDKSIIVINKPYGLACHGGSGIKFGLIELVRKHYNSNDINLVHRLDKETSGCIILARKRHILRHLHLQLRENKVKKTYLALLNGRLSREGIVKNNLEKRILKSGERMAKVVKSGGKEAITNFRILKVKNNLTLAMIKIHTGRTHQIRVQTSFLHAPIVGDDKYGDVIFNKTFFKDRKDYRMLLHAYELAFTLEEKSYLFHAKLDNIFSKCLISNGFSVDFAKN